MSAGSISLGRGKPAAKRRAKSRKRSRARVSPEYNLLLTATLCLLALGAVMVFSASSTSKVLQEGGLSNSAYYLKRTLIFGAVALVIMHVTARIELKRIRELTPLLLGGSAFLLVAVLGAGTEVNGATRWIGGGSLQIQPSELAKVALILYGADMLARKPKRARTLTGLKPYLLVAAGCCALIMLEPDMGTTMVIVFAVAATLVAAGVRAADLGKIALVIGGLTLAAAIVEPYRMARLTGFLHPTSDPSGAGFQAAQAKIALGSGGIFGVGIGNGVSKAFYLPEAHTDMITAVIGEELGMAGITAIVGLFGLFGYAGLKTAQKAKDRYSKLLVAGLTSLVLVQATINLFAVMGLAPLTGVPLPFVSYGNSSLMATLFAVGLILNVARGGSAQAARGSTTGAGKLRVVEGGRTPASQKRSRTSGVGKAKGGRSGGGNGGARRTRHGGRRRASG
jgi:cell division protein FtsW